jgi:8-oxo-dGTP pyrophosphatase MutT (NUDIX family)
MTSPVPAAATPAAPRPSTTVILVRDGAGGLEVLMVVRGSDRSQFSAAMVFPGGVIEPEDAGDVWTGLCDDAEGLDAAERARRVAGFRELYEETGILLLERHDGGAHAPAPGMTFAEAVRASGGKLDLSAMVPFAHWITPEGAPKRYDTYFRLCGLGTEMEAVSDGRETVEAEWLRPADAIALGDAGTRNLLFPTRCQLELLAESDTVEAALRAARGRPIVAVTPRFDRREDGTWLSIPPEAGYPNCAFRMPRRLDA